MLTTGLRTGELLGLLNSDIDLERRVLHLERGVKEVWRRDGLQAEPGRDVKVGKLKSATSKRTVPLNDTAIAMIQDLRKEAYFGEDTPLVPDEHGNYTRPVNFRKRYYRILTAAGIEKKGLHSLRHTFASTLVNGIKQEDGTIKSLTPVSYTHLYLTMQKYNLIDSIWGLVLAGGLPVFNLILIMNFFRGLPKDLEEAAVVDGAGPWRILFNIVVPCSVPVLATIVLFTSVNYWNEFFQGLVLTTGDTHYPLQTYIKQMVVNVQAGNMSMEPVSYTHLDVYKRQVVLSFHEDFEYVQAAMRLGAVDYISKLRMEQEDCREVFLRVANVLRSREGETASQEEGISAEDMDILCKKWESLQWVYDDTLFEEEVEQLQDLSLSLRQIERLATRTVSALEGVFQRKFVLPPSFDSMSSYLGWLWNLSLIHI